MNRGLILKSARELWATTLLFGLAVAGFEMLLTYVVPTFFTDIEFVMQMRFVRMIFRGLLGTEIGDVVGPTLMTSIAWVHPIVLALIWAHEITICTRLPADEIDRGTIDVLLSLPVSRTRIYVCATLVWLASGLFVLGMGMAGNLIGSRFAGSEQLTSMRQLVIIVANLFCLYLAVGGIAWLVSTLSDRRGKALGVAFGIVVASFLLNFLAQFWEPAQAVSFLSVLSYYRPLSVVQGGAWPMGDMLALAGTGVVLWLVGACVFARRDICTV